MGCDSNIVYILFGVQIPVDDKERVFTLLKCEHTRPKQRKFNISNTHEYDSCSYISSIPFGLGENDRPCGHTKIDVPTQEEVETFKFFLDNLDISYPYEQFFLPG